MKTLLALPALVLMAACQMAPPVEVPFMPGPDACAPDQSLVGQPESVLAAMTFAQGTRIYRSGDPVTADYSPNRLNIEIGPSGRIVAVNCG